MPLTSNSDLVYNSFHSGLMAGYFPLVASGVNVVLIKNTYLSVANPDNGYKTLKDIEAFESSGTGYTASGQALASKNIWQDDYADLAIFDAADTTWPSSTLTSSGAALYLGEIGKTISANCPLIAFFSFGGDKSSSNGAFQLSYNSSGILNLGNCA